MKTALLLLAALLVGALLYIRLAPSDPAKWHVDPSEAPDPGSRGVLLRESFDLPPDQALAAFESVAIKDGVIRLAGSVEAGHATYVARTAVLGFPDYITVKTEATQDGSVLIILSRLRFGRSDMGVNQARLERWLSQMRLPGS